MSSVITPMMLVQLSVVACVVFSLIFYLLRSVARASRLPIDSRPILISSTDSEFGRSVALWLDRKGFRVFAGSRDPASARLLKKNSSRYLKVIPLDSINEESLQNAAETIREGLPAGNQGLWAVLNTCEISSMDAFGSGGSASASAIGNGHSKQGVEHGPTASKCLEISVDSAARLSSAFLPLLSATGGRLIVLGRPVNVNESASTPLSVATRWAVQGLMEALRPELQKQGVQLVCLQPRILEENCKGATNTGKAAGVRDHSFNQNPAGGGLEGDRRPQQDLMTSSGGNVSGSEVIGDASLTFDISEDEDSCERGYQPYSAQDLNRLLPNSIQKQLEEVLLSRNPKDTYVL